MQACQLTASCVVVSCRREMLPEYKANRTKPAPAFSVDLANLKLLLRFTRIPTLTVPGYEADDVSDLTCAGPSLQQARLT